MESEYEAQGQLSIRLFGWFEVDAKCTLAMLVCSENHSVVEVRIFVFTIVLQGTDMRYRKERTQIAWDAVDTQRMQFQSLIIEQQMALIRVNRLYQEYSLNKSAFLELLPSPNHHHTLTHRDESEVNPLALVPYQEPSLSQAHPAHTEVEDLARVRHVAQPYVDMLLHRWTRLEEMESRLIEGSVSRRSFTHSDRGRWERPTVESDSEDDFGVPNDPNQRLNGSG